MVVQNLNSPFRTRCVQAQGFILKDDPGRSDDFELEPFLVSGASCVRKNVHFYQLEETVSNQMALVSKPLPAAHMQGYAMYAVAPSSAAG